MQEWIEPRRHLARLQVGQRVQVVPCLGPLQQEREPVRVGPQQPDCAIATPVAQRQMLVLGLGVRPLQLEHRWPAVAGPDRVHHGALAAHGRTVQAEPPAVDQVTAQGR